MKTIQFEAPEVAGKTPREKIFSIEVPDGTTVKEARAIIKQKIKEQPEIYYTVPRSNSSFAKDYVRTLANAALLGGGDEATAFIESKVTGKEYEDIRKNEVAIREEFGKKYPYSAFSANVAGAAASAIPLLFGGTPLAIARGGGLISRMFSRPSAITGGLIAKYPITSSVGIGAGYGAAGGALDAEPEGRARGAKTGAITGGLIGGGIGTTTEAIKFINPAIKKLASFVKNRISKDDNSREVLSKIINSAEFDRDDLNKVLYIARKLSLIHI